MAGLGLQENLALPLPLLDWLDCRSKPTACNRRGSTFGAAGNNLVKTAENITKVRSVSTQAARLYDQAC